MLASHTAASFTGGGSLGVDVFFVLSGFLITTLLVREHTQTGKIDLKAFYIRRIRRLTPALWAVVAVTAVVFAIIGGTEGTATLRQVPWSLTYVISWLSAFRLLNPGNLTHTWSLSVEEHFYLIWPVLLIFLIRRRKVRQGAVIATILAVAYALAWAWGGAGQQRMYFAPDTRIYSIMIGCALAVFLNQRPMPATRSTLADRAVIAAVVFIAAVMLRTTFATHAYYDGVNVLLALASAFVIGYAVTWPTGPLARLLATGPLVWIGRRSYGLYLWQTPVIAFFTIEARSLHGLRVIIAIGVSFALAALTYRYIERPFLARRTAAERGELAAEPAAA